MMEWERPYMEACVDALQITPQDAVLEIGFGCAYSAERIQSFRPKSHVIIECSIPVLERLKAWKKGKNNVVVVEGTWQAKVLPSSFFPLFSPFTVSSFHRFLLLFSLFLIPAFPHLPIPDSFLLCGSLKASGSLIVFFSVSTPGINTLLILPSLIFCFLSYIPTLRLFLPSFLPYFPAFLAYFSPTSDKMISPSSMSRKRRRLESPGGTLSWTSA
jgi:hypothetical protein